VQTVDGRIAITRKEWADQIAYSVAGVRLLYDQRAQNRHPESAFAIGRTLYWWKDELDAWWKERQQATKPAPIERVGDPDDLLFASEVAELLDYTNPRTVLAMAARGQFAQPDPKDEVPGEGQKSGQPRPRWRRQVVWEYADNRTVTRKKAADESPSEEDLGGTREPDTKD
jgi:hypothetical protein